MQLLLSHGITCLTLFTIGTAIKCYFCSNTQKEACGEHFKSYIFSPYECPAGTTKCGKQTQQPFDHNGKENWVGVMRNCYPSGSLPGINETDGCHTWTNPADNFTAQYCFCSTDSCNGATNPNDVMPVLTVALYVAAYVMQRFVLL